MKQVKVRFHCALPVVSAARSRSNMAHMVAPGHHRGVFSNLKPESGINLLKYWYLYIHPVLKNGI